MESSEKIKQKIAKQIEELNSICCEDADRARQARIDEIVFAYREESYDRASIADSNSGFTEQSKFLPCQMRENFLRS